MRVLYTHVHVNTRSKNTIAYLYAATIKYKRGRVLAMFQALNEASLGACLTLRGELLVEDTVTSMLVARDTCVARDRIDAIDSSVCAL